MILKTKLLSLLILCATVTVSAQFGMGKLEDIQKVKDNTLLIVLQEENAKAVKKFSKKQGTALADYREAIASYNIAIQEAFNESWDYSTSFKFIKESELENYNKKENRNKYVIFDQRIDPGARPNSLMKSKGAITTVFYGINLPAKSKPIYAMMYATTFPNKADFTFIISQFKHYFNNRIKKKENKMSYKEIIADMNKDATNTKNKTLLLDIENLTEEMQSKFAGLYPYDHKITTKEEIDQAILEKNEEYVFLRMLPITQAVGGDMIKVSKLLYVQAIYEAKDGQMLAYVAPGFGLGGAMGTALRDSKHKLKEKDLKKLRKTIEGK